jgi:hypothetical protein
LHWIFVGCQRRKKSRSTERPTSHSWCCKIQESQQIIMCSLYEAKTWSAQHPTFRRIVIRGNLSEWILVLLRRGLAINYKLIEIATLLDLVQLCCPVSDTLSFIPPQPPPWAQLGRGMSTRNLLVGKERPARKADNFTAICEPNIYKICEPRRLTTLWAYTACYTDNFTFTLPSLKELW